MGREFEITRQIGIDAGHRVPDHGSGCRYLHGHRYTIEATVRGQLASDGAGRDMVLDFGFLKEEMMNHIHLGCDHSLILSARDAVLTWMVGPPVLSAMYESHGQTPLGDTSGWWWAHTSVRRSIAHVQSDIEPVPIRVYVIDRSPTAEALAQHWYYRLAPSVRERTSKQGHLARVRVYETPNCWADYPVGA